MRRTGFGCFAGEIEFDAIAGRKQDRFGLRIAAAETRQGFSRLLAAECQPLSHFKRRRAVTAADHAEVHCGSSMQGPHEFKVPSSMFKVRGVAIANLELSTSDN